MLSLFVKQFNMALMFTFLKIVKCKLHSVLQILFLGVLSVSCLLYLERTAIWGTFKGISNRFKKRGPVLNTEVRKSDLIFYCLLNISVFTILL